LGIFTFSHDGHHIGLIERCTLPALKPKIRICLLAHFHEKRQQCHKLKNSRERIPFYSYFSLS
jgi:hypothetical protein